MSVVRKLLVSASICLGGGSGASAATLTTLYAFSGFHANGTGTNPLGSLAQDAAGDLYGTTGSGGIAFAHGVIFELTPAGTEIVLHQFTSPSQDTSLLREKNGSLVGELANNYGEGALFRLLPAGRYTVAHPFADPFDGMTPAGGLILGKDHSFYGTTIYGGLSSSGPYGGSGTVFRVTQTGQLTTLYRFTGGADGLGPYGGVATDASGSLYGTTFYGGSADAGVIYKLTPDGQETVLHSFGAAPDFNGPTEGLIVDAMGTLYGTTYQGGPANCGGVFKLTASGAFTILHGFSGPDGCNPTSRLTADRRGTLYGTTGNGGPSNDGVVFSVTPDGQESVIYAFAGHSDGSLPTGALIVDASGTITGATLNGGTRGGGTIFRITP